METISAIGESNFRLMIFASVFAAMAIAEMVAPRRDRTFGRPQRWFTNFGMLIVSAIAVRLAFPIASVGFALWAEDNGIGLFNLAGVPGWIAGILTLLVLDLAIWFQHLVTHKVPVLWRIHRVHHADRDFDFTTALRFHPIEILLSMLWKMVVIVALGAPPVAVFIFEATLNGMAMFNHANLKIPLGLDRILRILVVTPDMHRVHHSTEIAETDSNYGFNLSLWDRLFGTYVAQPARGHDGMTIGLTDYQSDRPTRLGWSLFLPFSRQNRMRRRASARPDRSADQTETPAQ